MNTPPTNPSPVHPDRFAGQMSRPNPIDRPSRLVRNRRDRAAHRRAHHHLAAPGALADRDLFQRRWSLLMIGSFSSREHCAAYFGVSFQTACNWFDGMACPYGHVVARAAVELPRFFDVMEAA